MIASININKHTFLVLFLIMILSFGVSVFSAGSEKTSSLVAPGAVIKTVKSGFNGTEGPAADADGNVYFTEKDGGTIQKWSWRDGTVSQYRTIEGGAIGMMFDAQGRLVICEFSGNVTRDDMKGSITVIADSCDGEKLHIPNDLWIDPKGGIYFSDFSFGNMGMPEGGMPVGEPGAMPQGEGMPSGGAPPQGGVPGGTGGAMQSGSGSPGGSGPGGAMPGQAEGASDTDELGICYISPDGKKVTKVIKGGNPNGLTGSPDGKTLYSTGGQCQGICSYAINADGTLGEGKLFCEQSTDGMAVDEKGNVYLIGDVITIYNPEGEKIEEITLPERMCKNLAFGGKDRKTLFITGNVAVYTLEMTVRGASAPLDLAKGTK